MAKGDLGEYYSILGTAQQTSFNAQRKALEDERKKARRDRYLSYLVEPIVGAVGKEIVSMVKSPFEEKYKDFANSALAIQQKVKTRAADTDGDAFEYKEKERATYAGGADAWFSNYSTKEAEREFLKANPERGKEMLDSGIYNSQISEAAKIIEAAKREEVKKERKLLDDYRATGKLEDNLKNRRTKTITGRFIDVFQKDSTEKQDARAQEEFEKSLYNTSREAYLAFKIDIEEGKSLVDAANAATKSLPSQADIAWGKDFTTTTISTVVDKDGNRRVVETTATFNRTSDAWKNGKQAMTTSSTEAVVLTSTREAEIEAGLVRDANAQFNYTTRARTDFTPEAYQAYKDEATKAGIDVTNIKSIEERTKAAAIFTKLDKKENYKAEASTVLAQKNRDIALMADLMTNDIPFQNASKDYRERDASMDGTSANEKIEKTYWAEVERMKQVLADARVALDPKAAMPNYKKQVIPGTPSVTKSPVQGASGTSGQPPIMPPSAEEEEEEAPVTETPAPKPKEGDTWNDANGNPLIFKGGTWVPDPNPNGAI